MIRAIRSFNRLFLRRLLFHPSRSGFKFHPSPLRACHHAPIQRRAPRKVPLCLLPQDLIQMFRGQPVSRPDGTDIFGREPSAFFHVLDDIERAAEYAAGGCQPT